MTAARDLRYTDPDGPELVLDLLRRIAAGIAGEQHEPIGRHYGYERAMAEHDRAYNGGRPGAAQTAPAVADHLHEGIDNG